MNARISDDPFTAAAIAEVADPFPPCNPVLEFIQRLLREQARCLNEAAQLKRCANWADEAGDEADAADSREQAECYLAKASALRWVEAQMRECGVLP